MSINYNGVFKTIDRNKNRQALDASITIRVNSKKKKELEDICNKLDMTVSSAFNAFVDKVINLKALPFVTNNYKRKRKLFVAEGQYDISDDVLFNDDISELFESEDNNEHFN